MNSNVKNIYMLFLIYNITKSQDISRNIMIRQLHSHLACLIGVYEVLDKLLIKRYNI